MSSGRKRSAVEAGLVDEAAAAAASARLPPVPTGGREMQGSGADGGKKHSIDSDEEEELTKTYNSVPDHEKMKEDDIEGQEDDEVKGEDVEEGIKITPFNLKEEQEEGTFTKDGNFVWKKEKEIVDSWLDNVDWVKVKEMSAEETRKKDANDEAEDEAEANYDELATYKMCLTLMKEGETVARAIKRLGGGKKALPKWRQKKVKETPEEAKNRELMMQLTGHADAILSRSGNMEIYEETYEKIAFKIKQLEPKVPEAATEIPDGVDDDDALDMFADTLDKSEDKDKAKTQKSPQPSAPIEKPPPPVVQSSSILDDQVNWEYKWSRDDEKVHGPHSSEEMLEWQNSGFFDKGVYVRKVGSAGDFLDGKRIDFDLYT